MHIRSGITAAVLGTLAPGAGHLYLGQARRFMLPALTFLIVLLALGVAGQLSRVHGATIFICMALFLLLFSIADSLVLGLRQGRNTARWYARWYVLLGWLVVSWLYGYVLTHYRESLLGYSMFRMTASTMSPTILPGDLMLVDTRSLNPSTTDIVIFEIPERSVQVAGRVISTSIPNAYTVAMDSNPDLPLQISTTHLRGKVTAVLWSPTRRQFGASVE
ncbi:S24/S26 family peptidase [Chitinolyticbacter albus]|uniref:S24/S26 family peptidase n=1 Tax=Chitinolyticbacter albus TaxID=2961951 RepID=UPI00210D28AB|nr:S24/S26 family peptidase [Chitinolyticbacter albus]